MSEKHIGDVTHYYDRISVAVIALRESIREGDRVRFVGRSTDFTQDVTSLQIEHQQVTEVGAGQEVAMRVAQPVRRRDVVFKVMGESGD